MSSTRTQTGRLGNVQALANAARQAVNGREDPGAHAQRQLVAEFCKLMARRAGKPATPVPSPTPASFSAQPKLSPRERQTLELLLRGDGEKQIAAKLKLSQHTVHIYIKALHKRFGVSSRSELLARFIPSPTPLG